MRPHNAHDGRGDEVALTTTARITNVRERGGEMVVSLMQNVIQKNKATSVWSSQGRVTTIVPDVKGAMIRDKERKEHQRTTASKGSISRIAADAR